MNRKGVAVLSVFSAIVLAVWFALNVWPTPWVAIGGYQLNGKPYADIRRNRFTGTTQIRLVGHSDWKDPAATSTFVAP